MSKSKKILTLKDIPEHTELSEVQVRLPESTYLASSLPTYGIENVPVTIVGTIWGDFFVKTDITSKQVYPLFRIPSWDEMMNWEVVK